MSTPADQNELALPAGKVLEGIVATVSPDGAPHLAPMGPIVDDAFETLLLRPYKTSTTYRNLDRTGEGVLHVVDDVDLLARAAVGRLEPLPALERVAVVNGYRLRDACRWYAFQVYASDQREERPRFMAKVVDAGRIRDFFGFNRAKHAVVEAAILATRLEFLPAAEILADCERLRVWVQKTGGEQEHRAFEFLEAYIVDRIRLRQQREMSAQ